MVKSTIIVRASDALPLAASVDDEQVSIGLADKTPVLQMIDVSFTLIRRSKLLKSTSSNPSLFSEGLTPTPNRDAL